MPRKPKVIMEPIVNDCAAQATINAPPKVINRNRFGLLEDESVKYIYTKDNYIDWRAMIPKEFLVPNKQSFISRNKPIPDSIDGLKDNELLTLLGGSKYLASLRGFESVSYEVKTPSNEYVVSVCTIKWIPNFETENRPISFSAIGDASHNNTVSFCKNYLGPIAENRAFVRAVRNFLRIQILSQEEVGGSVIDAPVQQEESSVKILNDLLQKHSISFDKVKLLLSKEGFEGADSLNATSDIPKYKIFSLIARIKDKFENPDAKNQQIIQG